MAETDLAQLLVSLQLADSAFPSGLYTLSHGMESFVQSGLVVPDGSALDAVGALLDDLLIASVGPGDATATALAHRSASGGDVEQVVRADRLLFASKLSAELRAASTRSGRALLAVAEQLFPDGVVGDYRSRVRDREAPGCQPVVSGVAYAAAGVSCERAVASDLFALANSVCGAALRLRLVDHRDVQVLLRRAAPVIEAVTADALDRAIDDLGGFAPMVEVCSAHHERAEARLFAS